MDRAKFLDMCRAVAVLPKGVGEVKTVPPELHVKFNGVTFYPIGYKLSFTKDGKPSHTAILHDLKANSILECDLLKVKE
jgi:hypothetical protein